MPASIILTMNVYTDPKVLDIAGAMDALPALPLGGGTVPDQTVSKATGTSDPPPLKSGQKFAPATGQSCPSWAILGKTTTTGGDKKSQYSIDVSAYPYP